MEARSESPISKYKILYVMILLKTMLWSLSPMLATIMREEEIRVLFMCSLYLKCKLMIIMCIVAVTYSYTKCQCIGRELDFEVICYMLCGVLHMLSNTIQFEHTLVFLKLVK